MSSSWLTLADMHVCAAPPSIPGAPRPPPIDPAVLERRKQSTACLLRRQLASVELNPDLVDEALYERFLELKNPQVRTLG